MKSLFNPWSFQLNDQKTKRPPLRIGLQQGFGSSIKHGLLIEPFRGLTRNSGKAWIGTKKSCFAVEVPNQILSGDESEKQVEDGFRA